MDAGCRVDPSEPLISAFETDVSYDARECEELPPQLGRVFRTPSCEGTGDLDAKGEGHAEAGMTNEIATDWIFTTMLIENDWAERGTGFLVRRSLEDGTGRDFLVTNKHVLNTDPARRKEATHVVLHYNALTGADEIAAAKDEVPLKDVKENPLWRAHQDSDVDVVAMELTRFFQDHTTAVRKAIPLDRFADKARLEAHRVSIADEVFTIGYPSGELPHATSAVPLVRAGLIASRIGERLTDEVVDGGQTRRRSLRGFLVDGGVVPGSSGSPVVLRPIEVLVGSGGGKGSIAIGGSRPALLLGILAEAEYAQLKTESHETLSYAGLGLALDASTISETVDLFFHDK